MKLALTTEIRCSPERLWPWLDDPELCKQWLRGMEEIRPVSDGPRRPGWQAKMFIREGGRLSEYDETILEYEPARRFKLRMEGGCFRGGSVTVDYRLHEHDGHTRLEYSCDAQMGGILRLLGPLFAIFGRMQARSFMVKLKQLAEQGDAAVAAR